MPPSRCQSHVLTALIQSGVPPQWRKNEAEAPSVALLETCSHHASIQPLWLPSSPPCWLHVGLRVCACVGPCSWSFLPSPWPHLSVSDSLGHLCLANANTLSICTPEVPSSGGNIYGSFPCVLTPLFIQKAFCSFQVSILSEPFGGGQRGRHQVDRVGLDSSTGHSQEATGGLRTGYVEWK